jgi:hypothetical protein
MSSILVRTIGAIHLMYYNFCWALSFVAMLIYFVMIASRDPS